MLANSYPSQQNNTQVNNNSQQQPAQSQPQNTDPNVLPPQPNSTVQSMRLRDDPPPVTPPTRNSRKRKSPPGVNADQQSQPSPATSTSTTQHVLPPPHTLVHPPPHMPLPPPGYQYAPTDYTPGGMPPPHPNHPPPSQSQIFDQDDHSPPDSAAGRALSSSKRAEQNRKAQRAFRERRDQHVKALESRSQLLDAALASADEANRRWEECRALVDQLRIENAALRATLSTNMQMKQGASGGGPLDNNGAHAEVRLQEKTNDSKPDPGGEASRADAGLKKQE